MCIRSINVENRNRYIVPFDVLRSVEVQPFKLSKNRKDPYLRFKFRIRYLRSVASDGQPLAQSEVHRHTTLNLCDFRFFTRSSRTTQTTLQLLQR